MTIAHNALGIKRSNSTHKNDNYPTHFGLLLSSYSDSYHKNSPGDDSGNTQTPKNMIKSPTTYKITII